MQIFVGLRGKEPYSAMQTHVHSLLERTGIPLKGRMELHAKIMIPSPITEEGIEVVRRRLQLHAQLKQIRAVYAMPAMRLVRFSNERDTVFVLPLTGVGLVDSFRQILETIVNDPLDDEGANPRFTVAKVPVGYTTQAERILRNVQVPQEPVRLDELVIYDLAPNQGWRPISTIRLTPLEAVA